MRNKVLVFEDEGDALAFVEELEEFDDFDIYRTANWSYVVSWLTLEPKADEFAALIFDLRAPSYKLGVYNNTPYDEKLHHYPSLYFIDQFIRPNHPELLKRIILYSAYFKEHEKRTGDKLEEFYKCDKNESGSVHKMNQKVVSLREC